MSHEDARAVAAWVADWFGSLSSSGRAAAGAVGPVRYRGSPYWSAPTPAGTWNGYYGWFELTARDGSQHGLRVSAYLGDEDERCYLVFVLDDTPTPTFEFHLEANRVHAVPGGWLLTHLKWIGLGAGGGSIGQDRVMGTVRRNAPWLLGPGFVDLGVLYRDDADPIVGIAGGDEHERLAGDGPEALERAATVKPDVILLDVMMPGMDGFEVCRRLRAAQDLAEVPVLMVTALEDRGSRLKGIEAGADDFISKLHRVAR